MSTRNRPSTVAIRACGMLILVAILAPASCKDGPSGPTNPFGDLPPCDPPGAAPESTWFAINRVDAVLYGRDVSWDRPTGRIAFSYPLLTGFIDVAEPSTFLELVGCGVPVIHAKLVTDNSNVYESTYSRPEEHEPILVLDHLSERAISGSVSQLELWNSEEDTIRVDLAFEVADDACSPPDGFPVSGYYEIDDMTDLYNGIETRWSRSVSIIALGEEAVADSLPRWGMTLLIREPVRDAGTKRVLTVVFADFTWASDASATTVRYYVFPPEAGYPTEENDLLEVGVLNNDQITASGIIPMQRQTFSPTGGTTWHETIDLEVCFDAR